MQAFDSEFLQWQPPLNGLLVILRRLDFYVYLNTFAKFLENLLKGWNVHEIWISDLLWQVLDLSEVVPRFSKSHLKNQRLFLNRFLLRILSDRHLSIVTAMNNSQLAIPRQPHIKLDGMQFLLSSLSKSEQSVFRIEPSPMPYYFDLTS